MRRASPRSVSASRPLTRAAHAVVLGTAVAFATQIRGETLETHAVARKKTGVVPLLLQQGMREPEHDRDVGIRARRQPFRAEKVRHVVAQGTDIDEGHSGFARLAHGAALDVAGDAAVVDLAVLERHSAEADHELGVLDDRGPARVLALDPGEAPHDVRHDVLGRGEAVGIDGTGEAADEVQQAVKVALGVVKLSGAAPPVGAGKDRGVAVDAPHPLDLGRDETFGVVPGHRNQGLGPAPLRRRARTVVEVRAPHRRLHDANRRVHALDKAPPDRGGILVAIDGQQLADSPPLHPHTVRAVVVRGPRHGAGFNHCSVTSEQVCPSYPGILRAHSHAARAYFSACVAVSPGTA